MPKLFRIGKYVIFFWANENNEPIHVHIGIVTPSADSTKIWITKSGDCIVANNYSRIPQKDLNQLLKIIKTEHSAICNEWKKFFDVETIKYYC